MSIYIRSTIPLFIFVLINTLVNYDVKYLILSFVFLFFHCYFVGFPFRKSETVKLIILVTLLLVYTFKFIEYDFLTVHSSYSSFNPSLFIKLLLLIFVFFTLRCLLLDNKNKENVFNIFEVILKINVYFVFIQFITYIVSGYYLDVCYIFNGVTSRYLSNSFEMFSVFRVTGFYEEPSTLGAAILALLSIYSKSRNWKIDKLFILSIIACFLTLSTAIWIIAAIFAVSIVLFNTRPKNLLVYALFLCAFFAILFTSSYYAIQVEKFNSRVEMRTGLIDQIERRDADLAFWGPGPYGVEPEVHNEVFASNSSKLASINDAGSLMFMIVHFGYFALIIMSLILFFIKDTKSRLIFLILSMTKISIFHPIYLFVLAIYTVKLDRD